MRRVASFIALLAVVAIGLGVRSAWSSSDGLVRRDAVRYWQGRARLAEARSRQLARQLVVVRRESVSRPSSVEAIRLASVTFGVPFAVLWRRAACESGPGPNAPVPVVADRHVDARARNASGATGLFQFKPSTFQSTPYAAFRITSPYANALAAGWMVSHGRGKEWACR